MVIQHERQGNYVVNEENNIFINIVERKFSQQRGRGGYNQSSGGRNSNKMCSYCEKSEHTMETCYRKHGFPPNYQFQKANSSVASSMSNDSYVQKDDDSVVGKDTKADWPTLTHQQYEKILALIQGTNLNQHVMLTTHQVSTSTLHGHKPADESQSGNVFTLSCHNNHVNGSWIIDSGATDHICSSLYWF